MKWLATSFAVALVCFGAVASLHAALRHESFDQPPATWEGVNNRNSHFPKRTVTQDFGHSPDTHHIGDQPGEIGGRLQPAGEPAWYGWPLPSPLTLDHTLHAEGRLLVAPGGGNFLIGFFNTNTVNEWRTPNALAIRINGRGDTFHCHFEYATRLWRAGAGVIGTIVPGERITARDLPSGQVYKWVLHYDPEGAGGRGNIALTLKQEVSRGGAEAPSPDRLKAEQQTPVPLVVPPSGGSSSPNNNSTAHCELDPGHRQEGATFTHFGLLPVPKTWDDAGEVWIDDLTVNGMSFDVTNDPQWDALGNRRTYTTTDTRPRFDFGWSPTGHAGGNKSGEMGGLVFRGDCREPQRMACYGDRLETLTLRQKLVARGKVAMLRGVTDSTASIGFYHATHSMESNPSQNQSVPRDYLGINIEGPSSEGFLFYPVYRPHAGDAQVWNRNAGTPLRIHPDGSVHDWSLEYDPNGAGGRGRITVGLDDKTITLDLEPGHPEDAATFNRFGLCTPWIDGNSVTVYFDDLSYTASP